MTRAIQTIVVDDAPAFDPTKRSLPISLHTAEGDPIDLAAGGGGVGPVEPVDVSGLASSIHDQFGLINADAAVQLTVKGTCHANGSGDIGRVILMVSGDNGATGTELAAVSTTSTTNVPFTLSGLVPAGWKVYVGWTQVAAGGQGTSTITEVITQPLA